MKKSQLVTWLMSILFSFSALQAAEETPSPVIDISQGNLEEVLSLFDFNDDDSDNESLIFFIPQGTPLSLYAHIGGNMIQLHMKDTLHATAKKDFYLTYSDEGPLLSYDNLNWSLAFQDPLFDKDSLRNLGVVNMASLQEEEMAQLETEASYDTIYFYPRGMQNCPPAPKALKDLLSLFEIAPDSSLPTFSVDQDLYFKTTEEDDLLISFDMKTWQELEDAISGLVGINLFQDEQQQNTLMLFAKFDRK